MMTCAIFERQSQQVKKTHTAFTISLFVDLKILHGYVHGYQVTIPWNTDFSLRDTFG